MATYTSIVTSKGQLVIPAALRKRYEITQGTVISFSEGDGTLILQPITARFVTALRGSVPLRHEQHAENRS